MVILSFVTVLGWLGVWGGVGSLGKHETGGGLEGMNASGFLDGKGITKKKKSPAMKEI